MAGSNSLRMSGINSGFDTEAMVDALTATTKLKITNNERKVLKLQAQQEAYRSIITQMTDFKDKYFDVLNTSSYLKSSTIFNSYESTLSNSAGTNVNGVTSTCTSYATPATYDITVNTAATQATLKSAPATASSVNVSSCNDENSLYTMSVTYAGEKKNITFNGGDAQTVRENINEQLAQFGVTDSGESLVSISADNKIVTTDKASVAMTPATLLTDTRTLDLTDPQTGATTFDITVGNTTKSITVSLVSNDYFDEILDENGEIIEGADQKKVDFYNKIRDTVYDDEIRAEYAENPPTDEELDTYFDSYFEKVSGEQYDEYFEKARKLAYDTAVENGTISKTEGDENYVAYDDFAITDDDFAASEVYAEYEDAKYDKDAFRTEENEYLAYKEFGTATDKETFLEGFTTQNLISYANSSNLINTLGTVDINGVKFTADFEVDDDGNVTAMTYSATDASGNPANFTITQNAETAHDFGIDTTPVSTLASQISTTSKLSELGLNADAKGNYNFSINGVDFSFDGDTTVRDMMKAVNTSEAGVKMSYTTLTNSFTITANEYGNGVTGFDLEDGAEGLLASMGFNDTAVFTAGKNLNLTINGIDIETASNSYEVDGTKFTFSSVSEGTSFTSEVTRDNTQVIDTIKSFVEDYNKLIETVYGYTDQEPNDKYYFLTDSDLEDLDLSESQEEKWEEAAKLGILYKDSTLTTLMSKFRSSLYNGVKGVDGETVGLYTIGITTSNDWSSHGKLVIDEKILEENFDKYADEIAELFTNSENGIMNEFETILNSAVKTTGERGEKGLLVQKAGVTATSSATDNQIYDQIKSIQTLLDSLEERYEEQQDRYWARFSNMETMLSKLNQQTSSISQLLGG